MSRSVGYTARGAPALPMTGSRDHRELRVNFCGVASMVDALENGATKINGQGGASWRAVRHHGEPRTIEIYLYALPVIRGFTGIGGAACIGVGRIRLRRWRWLDRSVLRSGSCGLHCGRCGRRGGRKIGFHARADGIGFRVGHLRQGVEVNLRYLELDTLWRQIADKRAEGA